MQLLSNYLNAHSQMIIISSLTQFDLGNALGAVLVVIVKGPSIHHCCVFGRPAAAGRQ